MRTLPNVHHCRGCGQRIILARTQAGKYQALDHIPNHEGNVAAYQDALGTWRARTLKDPDTLHAPEHVYMPHAASCPATSAAEAEAPGVTFLAEYRKAKAAHAKAKRNRRGKRKPPPVTGYRVNPPAGR